MPKNVKMIYHTEIWQAPHFKRFSDHRELDLPNLKWLLQAVVFDDYFTLQHARA